MSGSPSGSPSGRRRGTQEVSRGSKRGEHVINHGVLRIYRDIIDDFVKEKSNDFSRLSFRELLALDGVVPLEAVIRRDYSNPLPVKCAKDIDAMTVHYPPGHPHNNENARVYLEHVTELKKLALTYMASLFLEAPYDFPGATVLQCRLAVESHVRNMNAMRVYVDKEALEYWLREGPKSRQAMFEEARQATAAMLLRLSDPDPNFLADRMVRTWNIELREVKRRLAARGAQAH